MSEPARALRRRERVYLGLGALGPVLALAAVFAAWPALPSLSATAEGLKLIHFLCLVAGLGVPLAIQALFSLADGRPLMLFRKGLTASVSRELSAEQASEAVGQLAARATALDLSFRTDPANPQRWQLSREKDAGVHEFRQNAFSGSATLQPAPSGRAQLSIEMTFEDRLLVESGEAAELENLCRELVGLETRRLEKQVPLLLLLGWFHALACAAGCLALGLGLTDEPGWVIGPAWVGAGVLVYSLVVILMSRGRLVGLWLVAQGLLTVGLSVAVFLLRASAASG